MSGSCHFDSFEICDTYKDVLIQEIILSELGLLSDLTLMLAKKNQNNQWFLIPMFVGSEVVRRSFYQKYIFAEFTHLYIIFLTSSNNERDTKFDTGRPERKSMLVPTPNLKL